MNIHVVSIRTLILTATAYLQITFARRDRRSWQSEVGRQYNLNVTKAIIKSHSKSRNCDSLHSYLLHRSTASAGATRAAMPLPLPSLKPPNFVFVVGDDIGYGDLHCYGHPYAKTTFLDRLAREGTLFRKFYTGGRTCAPSRAALMTSRNPVLIPYEYGLGNQTLTQMLYDSGYAVAHFGKWHLGKKPDASSPVYGFDMLVETHASLNGCMQASGLGIDERLFSAAIAWLTSHLQVDAARPFYINVWPHTPHDPVFTCQVEQASTALPKQPPFDFDVHDFGANMQAKLKLAEEAGINTQVAMGRYLRAVSALDINFGRLMAGMEKLRLQNDTVVVFTSDHGPDVTTSVGVTTLRRGVHEFSGASPYLMGYAGGLRGGKFTNFDGGLRAPFIVRWRVAAGRKDNDWLLSGLDWMPTVLELAGICPTYMHCGRLQSSRLTATLRWQDLTIAHQHYTPHKDGQRQHRLLQPPMAMEGESMVNAWLGRPYAPRRRSLMWRAQTNPSDTGLAMRTDRWKLHVIPSKVARKWKQHEGKDSTKKEYKMPNGDLVELYDIDNDLTELKSVAHSNQEVVSNLVAELLRWNDTLPTKAEMDHQRKAYKEYYSRKTRSQERRLEEEAESSSDTSFEIDNAAIWAIVRALNATKQKLRARINPARVSENSIAARHGSSIAARHVSSESHSAIELLHSRSGLSDSRSRNSGSSSSGGDFTGAKVASVENSYELKRLRAKLLSLIGPRDGSSCWKEAYRKLPPMVDPTASALLQETNADVTRSVIKRP